MSDHNPEADDTSLLESALSDAFTTPPDLKRQSASIPPKSSSTPPPEHDASHPPSSLEPTPAEATVGSGPSAGETDALLAASTATSSWEVEYEEHVKDWRAKSAEAREKAEKERAKWEAIREKEREEKEKDHGWEDIHEDIPTGIPKRDSPSPADARDSVTGEPQKHKSVSHSRELTSNFSRSGSNTGLDSQPWEGVSDSIPSLESYPGPSRTRSPSPSRHHQGRGAHEPSSVPPPPQQHRAPAAPSVTLSIFDSSLPASTRTIALLSSLAINMLLPFVNGVMLGFGEIFAKNVLVGWLGWNIAPGSVASHVGVGLRRPGESEHESASSSRSWWWRTWNSQQSSS